MAIVVYDQYLISQNFLFADKKASADSLNPLTRSHTAKIISFAAIGSAIIPHTEICSTTPNSTNKAFIS